MFSSGLSSNNWPGMILLSSQNQMSCICSRYYGGTNIQMLFTKTGTALGILLGMHPILEWAIYLALFLLFSNPGPLTQWKGRRQHHFVITAHVNSDDFEEEGFLFTSSLYTHNPRKSGCLLVCRTYIRAGTSHLQIPCYSCEDRDEGWHGLATSFTIITFMILD